MEPNDWPADMRNHNLSKAARDAYWHLKDCERAAEGPLANVAVTIAMNVVAAILIGPWMFVGLPVVIAYCIACLRRSKAARPAIGDAKAKLEALKARGAKVRL